MTYLPISSLIDIKHQPVIGDLIYGSDSYYAQITRVGESIVEFDVIGQIANLQAIFDYVDNRYATNILDVGLNLNNQGSYYRLLQPRIGTLYFDSKKIESPFVFWDSKNLRYCMTYTGYADDGLGGFSAGAIGLAVSKDLIYWFREEQPIFTKNTDLGQPDSGSLTGASIYIIDDVYYMFYIGSTLSGYEEGIKTICMAYSTDLHTWTRSGSNPLISPTGVSTDWNGEAIFKPNIIKWNDGFYYMFFNALGVGGKERIGYAKSPNLTDWVVQDMVLEGTVGTWDETMTGDPFLYDVGDEYIYMAYFGVWAGNFGIRDGVAYTKKTDFPLGWIKYSGNPVTKNQLMGKPSIFYKDGIHYHFFGSGQSPYEEIGLIVSDGVLLNENMMVNTSTDINHYIGKGQYRLTKNKSSYTNLPPDSVLGFGVLDVSVEKYDTDDNITPKINYIRQIYTEGTNTDMWVRNYWDATWQSWKRITNQGDDKVSKYIDISGDDVDDILETGFYEGNNLTNAPFNSTGYFRITVQSGHNTDYIEQWAKDIFTNDVYYRYFIGGSSPYGWQKMGLIESGITSLRPSTNLVIGETYFDTTLGKMIVYNGSAWVNMDGSSL